MPLSFRSAKLEQSARELARLTGQSLTKVVEDAVAEKLERVSPALQRRLTAEELHALVLELREGFDFSTPITKEEMDALWDESEEPFRS